MKEEKGRKRSPRQTTETIVEEAVLQKIYQLLQKESLPEKLDYMGEIAKDATICSTRLTIKIIEKEGEKNYSVSLTGEHEDVSGHDAYRAIMRLKNIFE